MAATTNEDVRPANKRINSMRDSCHLCGALLRIVTHPPRSLSEMKTAVAQTAVNADPGSSSRIHLLGRNIAVFLYDLRAVGTLEVVDKTFSQR
jgi:hypothetical protein